MDEIIKELQRKADGAYVNYVAMMGLPSCLGAAQKLLDRAFGDRELQAHKAAERQLGRHQALHDAIKLIRAARHICTDCGGKGGLTPEGVELCNCDEPTQSNPHAESGK